MHAFLPHRALASAFVFAAAITATAVAFAGDGPLATAPATMASPAGRDSGEPFLAVGEDGQVWLSWIERRGWKGEHALVCARLEENRWSEPRTIAVGDSFFVNWADMPTLLPLGGGRLAAHWPWKRGGENPYAYDVVVGFSEDGGTTWTSGSRPHRDDTATEHGFVSMVPADERARLVWLDGRNFANVAGHGEHEMDAEMTLRSALVDREGRLSDEALVDGRVCDCCQTAAVRTARGVLVAYRDRSPEEVRDISLVRFEDGRWSEPYSLHRDGWNIPGCPVNGPALGAVGDRVAAAWFTGADDVARVEVAFSDDGGALFGPPVRVDQGDPLGRVDVVVLDDGSAVVSWLEEYARSAEIRARWIERDGTAHRPWTIARTRPARKSGFPRMVRGGDRLVFAWTEIGTTTQVRTATARLKPAGTPNR